MGTRFVPAYANLILSVIEDEFSDSLGLKPLCWLRFIDDIFVVYQHGTVELYKLLEKFNSLHGSLKLSLEWSYSEVAFLDTVIQIKKKKLKSKLY